MVRQSEGWNTFVDVPYDEEFGLRLDAVPEPAKTLILLASRPETVEIAVRRMRPETLGVIISQEILEPVVLKCSELKGQARFLYRVVDSPMEIGDSFSRFEHLLSELEEMGHSREEILLDATGGTTPMRLGAALAAMTRGISMVYQRVPQIYADGRWERDPSREVEVAPMGNPLEATGLLREGQAVELFSRRDQWRLQERHSISTGSPDWSGVDGETRKRFLEAASLEELPEVLGLRHARILDRILGGEVREDDEVLSNLLQQRNRSILAHGLEPIDGKSALRFLEYVDEMVDVPEARVGAEHARLRRL